MDDAPVILQPDLPVRAAPLVAVVPAMAFWARQAPDVPKPPRRQLVIPGRSEPPAPPPNLDAPPVLAVPNREPDLSQLNMAIPAQPTLPPALAVPNSATVPIRVRDSRGEPQAASIDPLQGQSLNLIAIFGERRPAGEVVEIPRGLQNIPPSQSGDGGLGDGAAPVVSHETGDRPGRAARANGGPGAPGPPSGASAPPGPASRSENAAPAQPERRASAAGKPAALETASAGATARSAEGAGAVLNVNAASNAGLAGAAPATRILHPAVGSFDVVIMQSSTPDDLPEIAGLLNGSPVYTVYLRVGDETEWLLKYCIPTPVNTRSGPYQVEVGDEPVISPPYPVVTVVPNSILGRQHSKHIVLHGFMTAAGRLRDLTSPEPNSSLIGELLPFLAQWQFRPALRKQSVIEVEILLVIPPRS